MLEGFRYCALCGSPLSEILLPTEERLRLVCRACGYVHYVNPKIVCGTLPVDGGQVWLLRRAIEPRVGYWTHPAGFQEFDESSEEAAIRETREEIGCDVEVTRLLGVYSIAGGPVVNIVYLAQPHVSDGVPCTTKEALEVRAFWPYEIPWDALAFQSTALALEDWLRRE